VSRRKGLITARRAEKAPPSPDLVERQFKASHINELWVADITCIPTWTGFLYLAVVLDACSRKIVGWSMALSLHTQIVLDALEMALWQRRPKNVIHHSDQGSQYTSLAFGNRCQEAGVRPSMGSVGDAYDNAMCESFFATLECELLNRRRFKTQAEAKMAVFEFIEGFYNPRRRHSALGYMAPDAYEALALPSGSSYRAAVLVPVKGRPQTMGNEAEPGATAALDRDCARQQSLSARRDGKTASTEQKDGGCSPLINP
jgi:putative transposase